MSDNLYNYESDTSDDEFNCIYKEFEYLESKKKRRRKRILGYESDSGDSDGDESDHRFSYYFYIVLEFFLRDSFYYYL